MKRVIGSVLVCLMVGVGASAEEEPLQDVHDGVAGKEADAEQWEHAHSYW